MPAPDGPKERVEQLLNQMTLEEKAGQLCQYFYFAADKVAVDPLGELGAQPAIVEEALRRSGAGALLFVTDPGEINRLQQLVVQGNRLGIPALFGFDVIHGLRTILPVPIAMAATWDTALVERGNAVAAREARAVGIHWAFAPNVDIARDPRWGRMVEGAGEDAFLGAAVAAAQVRGFQGDVLGQPDRIIAGPKHFAGYGAAIGGRDYDEVDLSDSELWNTYLAPFEAAVAAGAGNIMTAYMPLNGIPATGNRWLITNVLRDTWGFDGFVVCDADAVRSLETHHFAVDQADAAVRALTAGVDVEMAAVAPAFNHLPEAVRAGRVGEADLDTAVRRVLSAKAAFGLLDEPFVDEAKAAAVLADPAHRDVARQAASASLVLLKNDGDLLPIAAGSTRSIAVIGPLADSKRDTLGPWVFDFDLDETSTVLDGLREQLGEQLEVRYEPGIAVSQRPTESIFDMWPGNRPADPEGFEPETAMANAVDAARSSDLAVVVLGEWQHMIGENASRSSLDLPGDQAALLEAVVATGTPTVLLLMSGRPLDLRWAKEHVPAIVQIWYPGTSGGRGVADTLLGVKAPTGRLPFSWPRTVGQIPTIYSQTRSFAPHTQAERYWDEESTPLFPFGYGLTYAQFVYSNIQAEQQVAGLHDTVTVTADLTNVGGRAGVEVAQLYLHQRSGSAARPLRLLKGFQHVSVEAGETVQVRFEISEGARRYWNSAAHAWLVERATFDVGIGGDAQAPLLTSFTIA